jgi:hypothetical protein
MQNKPSKHKIKKKKMRMRRPGCVKERDGKQASLVWNTTSGTLDPHGGKEEQKERVSQLKCKKKEAKKRGEGEKSRE